MNVQSNLSNQSNSLKSISNSNTIKYGTVKSVQRGELRIPSSPSNRPSTINLSTINPSKSLVVINGMSFHNNNLTPGYNYVPGVMLTSNTLTFDDTGLYASKPSYFFADGFILVWQVIEFY